MVERDNDQYLKTHGIPHVINEMIELCLTRKSAVPLRDMAEFLHMKSLVHEGRPDQFQMVPSYVVHQNPALTTRRTSIICTIGMNNTEEFLETLIDAGMDVMRINCSHGTHDTYRPPIENCRTVMKRKGAHVALMLDTKGPEIRTGVFEGGKDTKIETGSMVKLQTTPQKELVNHPGNSSVIHLDYMNLPQVVQPGNTILVDDGLLGLTVKECGRDYVMCEAQNTAVLGARKGVNLPGVSVDLPAVSEKDRSDLLFAVEMGMDAIAASFIRKGSHVREIREILGERGRRMQIISKIENQEGLDNFDEILAESDGIMVARGDMGVEIPPQKVFLAQKMIIRKCNLVGKPVVTATQMLESMVVNPRPTRAETADVANAVLDGSDCVMLSGETAKGKYPKEAVTIMASVCQEAEAVLDPWYLYNQIVERARTSALVLVETIASAAVKIAIQQDVRAIVVITETGDTARLVSKYRPPVKTITVVFDEQRARLAMFSRGLQPLVFGASWAARPTHDIIEEAINQSKTRDWVKSGDLIVAIHDHDAGDEAEMANYLRTMRVP